MSRFFNWRDDDPESGKGQVGVVFRLAEVGAVLDCVVLLPMEGRMPISPESRSKANVERSEAILKCDDRHRYSLGDRRIPGVSEVLRSVLQAEQVGWERGMTQAAQLIEVIGLSGNHLFSELTDMERQEIYACDKMRTTIIQARDDRQKLPVGQFYLDRGSALHLAVKLELEGKLDRSSLDPRIIGRLDSINKFIKDENLHTLGIEQRLMSKEYHFAGQIDWWGFRRFMNQGEADEEYLLCDWKGSISKQSEIQLGAYSLLMKPIEFDRAAIVECSDDGNYRCKWMTAKELKLAGQTFLNFLSVYNCKLKNGFLGKEQ